MIGKVTFGSGARGLARYVTAGRDRGVVGYVTGDRHEIGATAYRNLAADTPTEAAREMALTSKLSTRCEKPFMHLSLSWHPSERPEEPRMLEAMDKMLGALGLEDRQAVYAVHREKAHLHVHAAVNRVGVEGTAWDRWECKERIAAQCRVLEREMQFEPIEKYVRTEQERTQERTHSPREQRIYERSGIEPPERTREAERDALRERIGKEARSALCGAASWAQAHERLGETGVALEAYAHPKTARTGLQLVEIATGERCAASAIGSDYGRRALEKRLGTFEPSRSLEVERGASRALEATERARTIARSEVGERARTPEPSPMEPGRQARAREAPPSGPSLWDDYASARDERRSERERATAEQRKRDSTRRDALRTEHRARTERAEKLGFPPALARALGSECAFAYASQREALDAVIAREREALQEQHRAQSWTAYVVARAELGDERAVGQLWQWGGQERGVEIGQALEQPAGPERTAPVVRSLQDLHARVDTRSGEVAYHWKHDGREAFRDRGDLVTVPGQERDAMRAALRLAAAKWAGEVQIHGGEGFKRAAVEEAVKMGVRIINPEMQAYQGHVREQARERAQEFERSREIERSRDRGMSMGR